MSPYITISYCCPACGFTWDEAVSLGVLVGACPCPSCEEPVHGTAQ